MLPFLQRKGDRKTVTQCYIVEPILMRVLYTSRWSPGAVRPNIRMALRKHHGSVQNLLMHLWAHVIQTFLTDRFSACVWSFIAFGAHVAASPSWCSSIPGSGLNYTPDWGWSLSVRWQQSSSEEIIWILMAEISISLPGSWLTARDLGWLLHT